MRIHPGAIIDVDDCSSCFVDIMKYADSVAFGIQPIYLRRRTQEYKIFKAMLWDWMDLANYTVVALALSLGIWLVHLIGG